MFVTAEERKMQQPLVMANLDGEYRAEREANAIAQARNPNYDKLLREFPTTLLRMRSGGGNAYTCGERGTAAAHRRQT